MSEFISVSRNGGILEIIFDKPKVNAICATTSRELAELGLINEVVTPGQAMTSTRRLADELILGAALALAAIKQVVQLSQQMSLEQYYHSMYNKAWPALDQALTSEDFDEGINTFMEKRNPDWKGR